MRGRRASCAPLLELVLVLLVALAQDSWAQPTDDDAHELPGHLQKSPRRVTEGAVLNSGRTLLNNHTDPIAPSIADIIGDFGVFFALQQIIRIPFPNDVIAVSLASNSTYGCSVMDGIDDCSTISFYINYLLGRDIERVPLGTNVSSDAPAARFSKEYLKCLAAAVSDDSVQQVQVVLTESLNFVQVFSYIQYRFGVDLEGTEPEEAERIASGLFGGGCDLTQALYDEVFASEGAAWNWTDFQAAARDPTSFLGVNITDIRPPSTPTPSTPTGSCDDTYDIFLAPSMDGNSTRVGIDVCAGEDTHDGSILDSLDGPDYTFLVVPVASPRFMTVRARPVNGTSFHTYLGAFETCDVFHDFDNTIAKNNSAGDVLTSEINFMLEPGQGIYVVLGGRDDNCGLTDVVFEASFPPMVPPSPAPPPSNCDNAHNIFLTPSPANGINGTLIRNVDVCRGGDSHEGDDPSLEGNDYTFYIMPTASPRGMTIFTTSSGSFDTYLWAFEDCDEFHSSGTAIAKNDTGGGVATRSLINIMLEPNQGIYVVLGGSDDNCGLTDVNFVAFDPAPPPPVPPASNCDNTHNIFLPPSVDGNQTRIVGIDVCAGRDSHDGDDASLEGNDYTFYIMPTASPRAMTVSTRASDAGSFDTYLWAFEDCDEFHSSGTTIAKNDNEGDVLTSEINFALEPNQGVYVVLGGFDDSCGPTDVVFEASLQAPPSPSPAPVPPASSCDNTNNIFLPPSVDGNQTRVEGIDVCAGRDTHDGSNSNLEGDDYTFYLQPTSSPRAVKVSTKPSNGSEFDTYLWAFKTCDEFHDDAKASNDDGGPGLLSTLSFTLEPNEGIYIVLGGFNDECGLADVEFEASPPPPASNCSNTHNISLPGSADGNTTRVEAVDTCFRRDSHDGSDSSLEGPDYTFYIMPTASPRTMTVSTAPSNGSQYDTYLWAFETCDEFHNFGTATASDDDGGPGLLSELNFMLEANKGVYVVLGGYDEHCGLADVVFEASLPESPPPPAPPASDCNNTHNIVLPASTNGSMTRDWIHMTAQTGAWRDRIIHFI